VVVTDRLGTIECVHSRFTGIAGHAREGVLGRNPRILKSGASPGELYRDPYLSSPDAETARFFLAG